MYFIISMFDTIFPLSLFLLIYFKLRRDVVPTGFTFILSRERCPSTNTVSRMREVIGQLNLNEYDFTNDPVVVRECAAQRK